jgi:leader peptidase (prepilin peptidase)/N-methyltransferase
MHIPGTYPILETCMGILMLLVWRRLVPASTDFDVGQIIVFVYYGGFVWLLFVAAYVDLHHYIIPDECSIYAVPFGVAGATAGGVLVPDLLLSWQQSLVGAAVGGGFLFALSWTWSRLAKVDAMGFGDVKLLAMIGSFLGAVPALLIVLMVAGISGSAVGLATIVTQGKGLRTAIPFGPYLCVGALVALLWQDEVLRLVFPGLLSY